MYSKFRFSKFKKIISRSIFDDFQLTHISLNSQTFQTCCNLKSRGTGTVLCGAFLLFLFLKELKHESLFFFFEQKYKV